MWVAGIQQGSIGDPAEPSTKVDQRAAPHTCLACQASVALYGAGRGSRSTEHANWILCCVDAVTQQPDGDVWVRVKPRGHVREDAEGGGIRFLDVVLDEERPEPESITTQSSLRRRLLWARNNAPTLVFTALFVGVNAAVFLARAYQYRHTNILEMGARACGQCLNLDCALLLLLILRRTVTRLRSSSVGHLLPCDQHVHFHKMAGWTVFLLSILHTLFHIANFGVCVAEVCVSASDRRVICVIATVRGRGGAVVVKLLIRRPKNFDFQPGEYVYLNVPSLARYEWHPFTISSAPEFEDYFTVHVRSVGEWTRRIYDMFKEEAKEEKEEKPAVQEGKDSPGMFNLAYSSDEDLREDATHTVIEVEEQDTGSQKGGRYINNLLEFNRKMSIYSRPAALLNVEMQRKPSVSPAAMESRCSGSFLTLERKKSCSLSNLAALKADLESSRRGDSGQSSLTGSTSSLDSVGENLCSTLARTRQHCFPSQNAAQNPDTMAHQLQLHSAIKKKIEVHVDGPYGTPSTRIFTVTHAVLIGAGIGVTPFASILQSVMMRYRAAKAPCPYCQVPSCLALPTTLRKLRKASDAPSPPYTPLR
ncbi:NADPH oxidase 5 [Portunus trituberculatus]|uniref:NADPH oxidase 5 n=1 Tax=Portunus trituberculatus TaxID=210409 RepID=A0A5B7DWJ1_PORTR|nr:NADPH oxidase 5 [Portunus trituberculatus]